MSTAKDRLNTWLERQVRRVRSARRWAFTASSGLMISMILAALAWLPLSWLPSQDILLGLGFSGCVAWIILAIWVRPTPHAVLDQIERDQGVTAQQMAALRLARGGQRLGSETAAKIAQKQALAELSPQPELGVLTQGPRRLAGYLAVVALVIAAPSMWRLQQRLPNLQTALEAAAQQDDAPILAQVSNLDLTLNFPSYLQRDSLHLKGSDGDLELPAGTRVQLRARPETPGKTQAAAVLLEGHRVGLTVRPDGFIEGEFLVRRSGYYRLALTVEDQELVEAKGHRLSVIPDHPPKVERLFPKERAELDRPGLVEYLFNADDDHGIKGVFLVYRLEGEADEQRKALGAQGERLPSGAYLSRMRRRGSLELEALGMNPGDVLHWCIEVEDNNDVTGPGKGRSSWHEIRIFDPSGREEELLDRLEAYLGTLVDSLALLLPRKLSPERWSEGFRTHLSKGRTLVKDLSDRRLNLDAFSRALNETIKRLTKAQAGYAAGRRSHAAMEDRLERDLLYLDDLLSKRRLQQISEYQRQLSQERQALSKMMEAYRDSPKDPELKRQILASIQSMRRRLEKIAARMAKLQRKVGRQHLNTDAMKEKNVGGELDRLEELVRAGKVEEAMDALKAMSESLTELNKQVDEAGKQFGGKEWRELKEKADDIKQELAWLKDNQERARSQLSQVRKAQDQRRLEAMGNDLKTWRKNLQNKLSEARGALEQIAHDSSWMKNLKEQAQQQLNEADDALAADALPEAAQATNGAQDAIERLDWAIDNMNSPKEKRRAMGQKMKATRLTKEVTDELERVLQKNSQPSRAERRAMEAIDGTQKELSERMNRLAGKMAKLNEMAPVVGDESREALKKAQGSSGQASQQLQRHQSLQADGHQGEVLKALGELSEQLEASGGGGQGSGMMNPFGNKGAGKQGGKPGGPQSAQGNRDRVEIPKGEGFEVPGAWREEILEAWREGVPGDHQESVNEYYEELVR
ncbi:MAG: hypothetical protein CMH58_00145 [Myxococcales bacterium]|nr:hypothetical protein [Myxococcales bacterium]